jgi:hypothetical protein
MVVLLAIQGGMSSMQLFMSTMQQSIYTMQLDLQECLKFHHPSSNDDEDDTPMAKDA